MIVPSPAILVPLLAAFILSALSYYKRDPVRRVTSLPFLTLATPLAFLLAWLALETAGLAGRLVSAAAFAVALATFAVAVRQARILLPKPKPG
jgi:uncharacterized membrane protein YfcA